jgi:phosphoribosyl 1,2-cyclic phosphodiesterase
MALYISSLNSGSNGNCYYIGNGNDAVLIDAGISCKETEKRMKRIGLDISSVKAIFVSHEHADHINGIRVLSRKYQLPVYITASTLRSAGFLVEKTLLRSFNPASPVSIGNLKVEAFSKSHDASDPHSFVVSGEGVNIGVFTDIGNCCKNVISYFSQCDAAFLESNYCEDMLMNGNYPYVLKKRISSDNGHLSNTQALDLFTRHRSTSLRHLILAHLSKNNNTPELVDRLFRQHAGSTTITVASRYEETPVFCIEPTVAGIPIPLSMPPLRPAPVRQLSLF